MSESHESTIAGVGTAHLSYPGVHLDDSDSGGDGFVINGIALGVGDVTVGQSGVKKVWPAEELEKAAETLEGKDLVRDHINTTEGKVGVVTEATFMEDVGVIYEAEVAPHYDELASDIDAGLMEVSVRAYHAPEAELEQNDDGALVVEDVFFDNLSVVNNGASPSNTADAGGIDNVLESAPTVEASASFSGGQSTATLSRSEAVLSHDAALSSAANEASDNLDEDSGEEEAASPPEWEDGDLVQWQANPDMFGKVVHNPDEDPIVMVEIHEMVDGELVTTDYTISAGYGDLVEYESDDEMSMTSEDTPADPDEEYAMDYSPDHTDIYASREDALDRANEIGLDGVHEHEFDGDTYYMPGDSHQEYEDAMAEKGGHKDDEDEYSEATPDGEAEEAESDTGDELSGIFTVDGTKYGIAPSEHDDESTNHPENAKYPMTSCTGEDSIESAWNLRANGNYNIDQSTLESRIRSVAEDMDCDMSVVGEGSEENEQAAELVDASVDDYVQWDWSDGTAYGQVTERISEDGACRTVDGNERCADGDRDVLVIQQVDEDGTEQDQRVLKYDDDSSVSRWNMSEQSASTIEQAHEAAMDVEEASMDELDEVYSDWSDAVNMTASQLESWSDHPCASEASVDSNAVITRNMRLLETNKSDWDADDIFDAKRTISFISRMSADGNKPESPKDGVNGCPSKWAISLLNWAFNPFDGMPDRPSEDEMAEEDTVAGSRTIAVATTATLSGGTSGESSFNSTDTMIEYESADPEELGDELDDPVVVEKSELENMADEADKAEAVEAELGALSEKLDEQTDATEVVDELSDEAVDMISGDVEFSVVEASKVEMFDEVQSIYAEELAKHWPGSDAEELAEKFTPGELREKVDEHEEAELSSSIQESEPEPEGGSATEEELSDDQDLEDAREEYAEELEAQGWSSQADKVRSGEIPIQAE